MQVFHLIKMQPNKKFINFRQFVKKLEIINPSNYRKLNYFWKKQNLNYFKTSEELCKLLFYLEKAWKLRKYYSLKAYNNLCTETMEEQFYLKKKGTYRAIKEKLNNLNLYNSPKKMKSYLLGLILTQLLWPSHYRILDFYKNKIKSKKKIFFLEIGAGHGLLSKYLLENNSKNNGVICDLSKQSLILVKKVLNKKIKKSQLKYENLDFFKLKTNSKFDFIIMGEVIEHVRKPLNFLIKAKKLLKKNGEIFLSTCANCAQVDHLFHFKCIKQIKRLIKKSNLIIKSDLISPSENIDKKNWKKEKIAINYCAILKKNEKS